MRAVVLGAGVAGSTTAYYLSKLPGVKSVTVLERHHSSALANSYANSGILSPLHSGPLFNKGTPQFMYRSLTKQGPATQNFVMGHWSDLAFVRFAAEAARLIVSPATVAANSNRAFQLSRFSVEEALRVIEQMPEPAQGLVRQSEGVVDAFTDMNDYRAAVAHAELLTSKEGYPVEILTPEQVGALVPGLAVKTAGGTLCRQERGVDTRQFVRAVLGMGAAAGVTVRYGVQVTGLTTETGGGRVTGIKAKQLPAPPQWINSEWPECSRGLPSTKGAEEIHVEADIVVSCLGTDDGGVLKSAGVSSGLYPVAGYSATCQRTSDSTGPALKHVLYVLSGDGRRTLFSPMGGGVRVAGYAECTGPYPSRPAPSRVQGLLATAAEFLPGVADWEPSRAALWRGFRPMRPDGLPFVGQVQAHPNLYVNAALGNIGLILSCGTASLLADMVGGRSEPLPPSDTGLYSRIPKP